MDILYTIFGQGKDLSVWQMCSRALVVFFAALVFIRISGRRSFGLKTAFDNIIAVLLGAVLSRAVVGASPFVPVLAASLLIVLLHRLLGWLVAHFALASRLFEGNKILVFFDGKFIEKGLEKALTCREDVMQGVRKSALTEDMSLIDKVYVERNGEVSAIKKNP